MFGLDPGFYAAALAQISAEQALVQYAQKNMTPEQFKEWQADRTAERRHQEMRKSIEQAGTNARPRGLGIFF